MIPTAPSRSRLLLVHSGMAFDDEPSLYPVPEGLFPSYRPLPLPVQAGVSLVFAALISAWNQLLSSTHHLRWRRLLWAAIQWCLLSWTSQFVLRDFLTPPSRILVDALARDGLLPSTLSHYEAVGDTKVHYLRYQSTDTSSDTVLYLNHGFGACSLSWLPALQPLVDRLSCRVGTAHDAPGFGLTARSDDVAAYTLDASARLGLHLLPSNVTSVILLGHSMGAITTLEMARRLDPSVRKRIVLVAPALGLSRTSRNQKDRKISKRRSWVDSPSRYILRRLVGQPGFWRRGLSLAWGDAQRLKDSDVARFQWPSIGEGWEQGLLNFVRAQTLPRQLTDEELVQQVLSLPNTTLDVVVGSSDRVVPSKKVRKFFESFSSVRIVEMEGLGHDPFEEDVEGFVNVAAKLLL